MLIEVFGLLRKESFHRALICAKDLHEAHPDLFRPPKIEGMLEFEWRSYIVAKRKELGENYWAYRDFVITFVDNKVLGSDSDLQKWAEKECEYSDYRPMSLYVTLAYDAYKNWLYERNRTFITMLINVDNERCGPLLIELYSDLLPKTCKNFTTLCTGEMGKVKKNEIEEYNMHYKGSLFFRLVKNGWIQGGDLLYNRGNDGCSIYGRTFEDEGFAIKHDRRGIVSMANAGRHTNGSQFFITLAPTSWMDNLYVAFGRIIEGSATLEKMEEVATINERPVKNITIADCRVMDPVRLETKFV